MDYTQFESTPLGGIDLQGFVKADDIVNIAVNYVCAVKEGESIFPYMYINAENTHFSAQYLLTQLKQKLPNQKWRRTYMYGAEVVHNHKEL